MKKETKQKLIYLRYILPAVFIFSLSIFALIPTHRYVDAGASREPISLAVLMSNSFEQGREILFAKANATVGEQAFARVLLCVAIVCILLYIIALASAVWSAVVALKLFISDDEESVEKSRTLFITFFPNRIVLCVVEALSLGFAFFPYAMPAIYSHTLAYRVGASLSAPDGLIFGVIFMAITVALSVICAPFERRFDADVFKKRAAFADSAASDEEEEYEPSFASNEDDEYSEMRSEQMARIREMLAKKQNNGESNDNNDNND